MRIIKYTKVAPVAFIFLLLLSSCSLKKQKKLNGETHQSSPFERDERCLLRTQLLQKNVIHTCLLTVEAGLSDVPLPLDAVRVVQDDPLTTEGATEDDAGSLFFYESSSSVKTLCQFFVEQMEVFGWYLQFSLIKNETFLFFKKNGKQCIISMRPVTRGYRNRNLIVLAIA